MILGDLMIAARMLRQLAPLIGDGPELHAVIDRIEYLVTLEQARLKAPTMPLFSPPKSGS